MSKPEKEKQQMSKLTVQDVAEAFREITMRKWAFKNPCRLEVAQDPNVRGGRPSYVLVDADGDRYEQIYHYDEGLNKEGALRAWDHMYHREVALERCGVCENCKKLERVKQRVLACANPPFSHADDGVVSVWNEELKRLPCLQEEVLANMARKGETTNE